MTTLLDLLGLITPLLGFLEFLGFAAAVLAAALVAALVYALTSLILDWVAHNGLPPSDSQEDKTSDG